MMYKQMINIVSSAFGYKPTREQNLLTEKLAVYVFNDSTSQIFLVTGYAGTGKTSVISTFIKVLKKYNINSVLLAPTGRAAKIIGRQANHTSYTIHKKIYRQKSNISEDFEFVLDKNFHKDTIFWVDEASMISNQSKELSLFGSGKLLDDLVYYVSTGKNCKLVLIGDNAQLPPVGLDISPALDKSYMENRFGIKILMANLKEIVRQNLQSGIVYNATQVRKQLFRTPYLFPKFVIDKFPDIVNVSGNELIDCISDCYDKYGKEETIVITRSNKRANLYNNGIRNEILSYEDVIETGDFLMIVKNNYHYSTSENEFIANGEIVELVRLYDYEEMYKFHFANVRLRFPDKKNMEIDTKILLTTLKSDSSALSRTENQQFFENILKDYAHIKNKKKRFEMLYSDPYFNALQVKYAYAVTCHKSQGGQWKTVFIDHEYLIKEMINTAYYRWLYTAITRAILKIYFVNFPKEFFR